MNAVVDIPRKGEPDGWKASRARRGEGFAGNARNILIALESAPDLVGLVRFNEFSLAVEFSRAPPWRDVTSGARWIDADDTELQIWLQGQDINVSSPATVAAVVLVAARRRGFHPVRTYLESLKWDGVPRLTTWLATYAGARGDAKYLETVGAKFLISSVARIMLPGCQVDHTLVLEGAQGSGKTTATRILAVHHEWCAGSLPDIHSKDAPVQLVGHWIIEISELKAIRTTQQEAVKSFLTQTVDTFRPPYGRRAEQFPRQCVFIATTNETEYLRDRTGNRRYWPVKCGVFNLPALERDRDQLWAEAMVNFNGGTRWHLTAEETALASLEQAERVYVSELESDVVTYLLKAQLSGCRELSVRDVLTRALNLKSDMPGYADMAKKLGPAVAGALEQNGWRKVARLRGEEGRRTLYRLDAGQGGQGI